MTVGAYLSVLEGTSFLWFMFIYCRFKVRHVWANVSTRRRRPELH